MPKLITYKRRLARGALLFMAALVCALAPAALAQKEAPATVSGRITDGEHGMPGVIVMLIYTELPQRFRQAARAKTDADGRFLLTNVAPGRYLVMPVAPAYIIEEATTNYMPGRPLTIVAGEEIKDIDFRMEAGGVITGRITDANGNPVVAEPVTVAPVEEAPGVPRFNFDQRDQMTDDRGVYRLFGLRPGRYRVWVGRAADSGAVNLGRRKMFRRTFYPDATEQEQARIVEVKSGIEATDVDIKVGSTLKTYKVSGRFVTADTNQPVVGVAVGYSTVDARSRRTSGFGGVATTNARGEFTTEGLPSGHYTVYASNPFGPQESFEFYSDAVPFEVTDSDVAGLTVKVKRGASVTGVVTIEGVSDPAAAARMLSAVRIFPSLYVSQQPQVGMSSALRPTNINPDGTFRVSGLPPGKLRLSTMNELVRGLVTTRVELNGANVLNGFDLADGAQVTGVHIVMTLGTATLVGQTTYVNGAPPPNARVMAVARLVGPTPGPTTSRTAEVDARGYFRIESMPPGEYEVNVFIFPNGPIPAGQRPPRSAPQRVVVVEGGEAKVAPVVDFQ